MQQYYLQLPKIELHCHLGGTADERTLLEKLRQRHSESQARALTARCFIPAIDDRRSPAEQMEMFEIVGSAFSTPTEKKQLAVEYIRRAVVDNVVYLELRTGGATREKYEAVLQAFEECRQLPIQLRMIASVQRSWSFETAETTIRLAAEYKHRGVVGVDLCGDPQSGEFTKFRPLFECAQRQHGLPFTCHFAESPGERDLQSILDVFPSRLGHCCWMHDQAGVNDRVLQAKIPIEACLASNINTMRLYSGLRTHPVSQWLTAKHPFILCTDNPGILCTTLSKHYEMLAETFTLSHAELCDLAKRSVEYIFADDLKQEIRNLYQRQLGE